MLLITDPSERVPRTSLADAPVHAQIFLRAGQMAALDKLRTDLLNASAVTLQRHVRGFVLRRRYARARRAAVTLQACPGMHCRISRALQAPGAALRAALPLLVHASCGLGALECSDFGFARTVEL